MPVGVPMGLGCVALGGSSPGLGLQLVHNTQRGLLRLLLLLRVVDAAERGAMATLGLLVLLEDAHEVLEGLVDFLVLSSVQATRGETDVAERPSQLATHLVADVLHDEVVLVVGLHIDLLEVFQNLLLRRLSRGVRAVVEGVADGTSSALARGARDPMREVAVVRAGPAAERSIGVQEVEPRGFQFGGVLLGSEGDDLRLILAGVSSRPVLHLLLLLGRPVGDLLQLALEVWR